MLWRSVSSCSIVLCGILLSRAKNSHFVSSQLFLQHDTLLLQYSARALIFCILEFGQFLQHRTNGFMLSNLRHLEQADQHRQCMLHVPSLGTHAAPSSEAAPEHPSFLNEVPGNLNSCAVFQEAESVADVFMEFIGFVIETMSPRNKDSCNFIWIGRPVLRPKT